MYRRYKQLKRIVKSELRSLAYNLLPLLGFIKHFFFNLSNKNHKNSSVLILPPASPGSLGDESLVLGLLNLLSEKSVTRISILPYKTTELWRGISTSIEQPNLYFLDRSIKSIFGFTNYASKFDYFYLIGADVLDGSYSPSDSLQRIRFAKFISKVGVQTSIISFSFNKQKNEKLVNELCNLPEKIRLISRDPFSKRRLDNFMKKEVILAADLGFLLKENEKSEIVKKVKFWIENQKIKNQLIFGLNLNPIVCSNKDSDIVQKRLLKSIRTSLIELFDEIGNISILFLPHDFRYHPNDLSLINDLISMLPDKITNSTYLPDDQYNAEEVRAIVKYVDFLFTGRMHLAIHGLSKGVPVACVTYQDKFDGLYEHFGLKELTISPIDACNPKKLKKFLKKSFEQRNVIHEKIIHKLPEVMKLAKNNVE